MKHLTKRAISLLLLLCLAVSLLPVSVSAATKITTTPTGYTSASDVDYVIRSGTVVNWGARNETSTFLSEYAEDFYTGSYTFDILSQKDGGTSQSTAPGTELYVALQTLMKSNHTTIQNYQATRQYYQYTDCVSNNYSQVSAFYSGKMVKGTWDGSTYNREHIWPDSKCISSGRNSNDSADIMTLRATTPSENSSRGNKAFGISSGYVDPGVSVRGDCARMLLYTYVRWGNTGKMWGQSGVIENLEILLRWMEEDPVDTWEMGRNDSVESITGTRNVFVDYPEFAWLLFGRDIPSNMSTPSGKAQGGTGSGSGTGSCSHSSTEIRNAKAATCTTDGYTGDTYCKLCGTKTASGTKTAATGHKDNNRDNKCDTCSVNLACSHGQTEIRNARQATCDVDGYTGDTYCKLCGTKTASGKSLPATGHKDEDQDSRCDICSDTLDCSHSNTIIRNAKEATCAAAGYTGDTHCQSCGLLIKFGTSIPKTTDHKETELRNVREATCSEEGYTGDTYCVTCDQKLGNGTPTKKLPHTEKTANAKDATCCEDGYSGDTVCAECSETLSKGKVLPAAGDHSYGEWVVTKEPTETEKGSKERICSVGGHKETAEIPVKTPVESTPDEPTEPQKPTEPEKPTEPQKPTDPQKPQEPIDPTLIIIGAIGVGAAVICVVLFVILRKRA